MHRVGEHDCFIIAEVIKQTFISFDKFLLFCGVELARHDLGLAILHAYPLQQLDQSRARTQVTPRPPHRSVRARLRHTAPTLGDDGKANTWPWMKDFGLWEKVIGQLGDPRPCEAILLT